jgi:hypothetical protein
MARLGFAYRAPRLLLKATDDLVFGAGGKDMVRHVNKIARPEHRTGLSCA